MRVQVDALGSVERVLYGDHKFEVRLTETGFTVLSSLLHRPSWVNGMRVGGSCTACWT